MCGPDDARKMEAWDAVERLLWSKWGGDFRIEPTWRDDEGGYLLTLSDGREFWDPSLTAAILAALSADKEGRERAESITTPAERYAGIADRPREEAK